MLGKKKPERMLTIRYATNYREHGGDFYSLLEFYFSTNYEKRGQRHPVHRPVLSVYFHGGKKSWFSQHGMNQPWKEITSKEAVELIRKHSAKGLDQIHKHIPHRQIGKLTLPETTTKTTKDRIAEDNCPDDEYQLGVLIGAHQKYESELQAVLKQIQRVTLIDITDESTAEVVLESVCNIERLQELRAALGLMVERLATINRKMRSQSNFIRHRKGLPLIQV